MVRLAAVVLVMTVAVATVACGGNGSDDGAIPPDPPGPRIYLLFDQPPGGPFLVPVARPDAGDSPEDLLAALLAGPADDERDAFPITTSAIPRDTELLAVEVAEGIATVSLSAAFTGGTAPGDEHARFAQVIYTLTSLDGIDNVVFIVNGTHLEDIPANREQLGDVLPPVYVDIPGFGDPVDNPAVVHGSAAADIDRVTLLLVNAEGRIMVEELVRLRGPADEHGRRSFTASLAYRVNDPQDGLLIMWQGDDDVRDGLRQHRVRLSP